MEMKYNSDSTIFELWHDENIIIDIIIGLKKSVTNNGNIFSEASYRF